MDNLLYMTMPREYKRTDFYVKDQRSDFLSSVEQDNERRAMLNNALNQDGVLKAFFKSLELTERAQELIPECIFNPDYQALLQRYYDQLVTMLAVYSKSKEQFVPDGGWKKIFAGETAGDREKLSYFFELPADSDQQEYYRGFIKREPLQTVDTRDHKDQLEDIFKQVEAYQTRPVLNPADFSLIAPEQLKKTIYFIDSRFKFDLLDLYRWYGNGVYDKDDNLAFYDHPLLHHHILFQNNNVGYLIPVQCLQYGKLEVITPEKIGILQENYQIIKDLLAN